MISDILVGLNVSAAAGASTDAVTSARHAEQAGFDFVSISDHPGTSSPSFETWTLLTWIAAATDTITVMPRVLALPLRIPPMIAKSAETLARLSHGRLILGLGAGADDTELGSMGLPARSPGEKLRGLSEAVEIIHGLWREPEYTHEGSIYHTRAAQLEPKPDRRIPIWFGTFGPRALDLTGRLADGWIPSRGYLPDDQIPVMQRRVLAAAEQAGRDPADVTCALNLSIDFTETSDPFAGPPQKIIESLRTYLDRGFTAFNLAVPDADPNQFVDEVLAGLRRSVTADR